METRYCIHCGAEVTAKFCGQCGARYAKKEVTLKSLAAVIFETVTNWEQKMVITLKTLVMEPGRVARAYIEGEQRRYFHPVKFVMFWGGLNFLASNYWKVGMGDIDPNQEPAIQQAMILMANYGSFAFIGVIPLLALAPFMIFHKIESKFVHYTVMLCFITGMNLLISIPTIAMEGIWPPFAKVRNIIGGIFPMIYCMYFYQNYFKSKWWKSFFAAILTTTFLLLGMAIIIFILILVFGQIL